MQIYYCLCKLISFKTEIGLSIQYPSILTVKSKGDVFHLNLFELIMVKTK